MPSGRINKYIWIIDTITRHGTISRSELSRLWQQSSQGDGNPIPHRTFFSYRRRIEDELGVSIKCNRAHEYYIDSAETIRDMAYRDWLLDAANMQGVLHDNRDISRRIHIEPVPSARQFLSDVLNAIRYSRRLSFSYASFARARPDNDIIFEPYFVKLFRQRWYMVGRRVYDEEIRTYSLDRVTDLTVLSHTFDMPEEPSVDTFFADLFGITQSHASAQNIKLKVNLRAAKYIRVLPLHESQREEQFSEFSIFNFRMKLTDDLLRHLLSLGADVEVLQPAALRLMMINALKETLLLYEQK